MNKHSAGPRKTEGPVVAALVDVVDSNRTLVAKVFVGDDVYHIDYEECQTNLRLILLAPSLWALLQEWFDWYCSEGISDKCQNCYHEQDCPLLKAQALFDGVGG